MQKSSIKYILKLSIPIFFANLAVPLVGIIDTSLMGNLEELSYLSATSIAANLFSMIFWSFGFLRMGTVGMVSNAFGQNNFQEITNILLRNLLFVLFLSLSLIILQNFILLLSLKIFSLSNDTSELFKQYFKIRIYSAPGELTIYIITGLFVGLQKTKISSLAVGFFSILNIILSIIFVTKYDLNIKGVAYGTLISAAVTSLIFLVYTFWYLNKISIINIDIKKLQINEVFLSNFYLPKTIIKSRNSNQFLELIVSNDSLSGSLYLPKKTTQVPIIDLDYINLNFSASTSGSLLIFQTSFLLFLNTLSCFKKADSNL